MRRPAAVIILLLLLFNLQTLAQDPYFEGRNIDPVEPGLEANVIVQSGSGLIYVGTNRGIYAYDGQDFDRLPVWSDEQHAIRSLFESPDGTFWAGTSEGMILQVRNDSVLEFDPEEGHPKAAVTSIIQTSDGLTWFGTYGEGVYYWNGQRMYNFNTDDGLPDDYVYDIVPDHEGNAWAATDRGLARCRVDEGMKVVEIFGLDEGLSDLIVISLAISGDSTLWFGTYGEGIGSLKPGNGQIVIPGGMDNWPYGPAESLLTYGDKILIGTRSHGIIQYDIGHATYSAWQQTHNGQEFSRVTDLLLDRQMNIWAASYGMLIRSSGIAVEYVQANTGHRQAAGAILADRNGNVYIARSSELWYHKKRGDNYSSPVRIVLNTPLNSIISLYEDECGKIWAGSFGDGLVIYNPSTGREFSINEGNGLRNGNILSIDGTGRNIWLATLGGAEHIYLGDRYPDDLKGYTVDHLGEEDGLPNNFIYKVFHDSKGKTWFGTDGNGISVLEQGKVTGIKADTSLSDLVVYSITEDSKGRIWFSTARNGIYGISDSLVHLDAGKGLRNYDIRAIAAMQNECLLTVHPEGISLYNIHSGQFYHMDDFFGLQNSGINLNAISILNNMSYIPLDNGFIRLNTDYFPGSFLPETRIRKVNVLLDPQDSQGSIKLPYNRNYLSFHYSGLWYAAPEKVSYSIMLEGHDMEWIRTADRNVTYANLPPGKYTFRVRSSIDGNFVPANESSYIFTIKKPFWKTLWFYILSALVATGTALLLIRIRERNLSRIKDLEKEKLLFEFETLKSQVNPHFLFNSFSTLTSLIEDDREMAVDYVQKLSSFFRRILENRDRDLISLEEEIELVKNYVEIQKKRFGGALELKIDIPASLMKNLLPPLVLQLLIENAVKHNIVSLSKPLTIEIYSNNSDTVSVRNVRQPKKDRPVSTGLGLENIRQRYAMLSKKEVKVSATDSYFMVELPLLTQSA